MFGLKAGAFVKTKKIVRLMEVKIDNMIHFREKVGVGNVQKIPVQMRAQGMSFENAPNGGMTDRATYNLAVFFQIIFRPSQ